MADNGGAPVARADDWPAQAADTIVRVVGSVRDKTTGPAIKVSRAVVYGLLAAVLGIVVVVLASIALVRILDVYLPSSVFGDTHVWAAYLILGVLFTVAGFLLWAQRGPTDDE